MCVLCERRGVSVTVCKRICVCVLCERRGVSVCKRGGVCCVIDTVCECVRERRCVLSESDPI